MSQNLQKSLKDLKFISKIKCPKTKKVLLRYFSTQLRIYNALRELCLNIIKDNFGLDRKNVNHLSKYKRIIRSIATKSKPKARERKRLIVQSGGFLSYLIPLALSFIELIKQ